MKEFTNTELDILGKDLKALQSHLTTVKFTKTDIDLGFDRIEPTTKEYTCPAYYVHYEDKYPEYSFLRGPNGFECVLTDVEDKTWCRDGAPVVNLLNIYYKRIKELEAIIAENKRLDGIVTKTLTGCIKELKS